MEPRVIVHCAFIWALKALKATEQLHWSQAKGFDGSTASISASAQEAIEALEAGKKISRARTGRVVYDRFCAVCQDYRFQAWELAPFFFEG